MLMITVKLSTRKKDRYILWFLHRGDINVNVIQQTKGYLFQKKCLTEAEWRIYASVI